MLGSRWLEESAAEDPLYLFFLFLCSPCVIPHTRHNVLHAYHRQFRWITGQASHLAQVGRADSTYRRRLPPIG